MEEENNLLFKAIEVNYTQEVSNDQSIICIASYLAQRIQTSHCGWKKKTQWVCCSACPSVCVGSKEAVVPAAAPPGSAKPQCPQSPPKSLSPLETRATSCSPLAL